MAFVLIIITIGNVETLGHEHMRKAARLKIHSSKLVLNNQPVLLRVKMLAHGLHIPPYIFI